MCSDIEQYRDLICNYYILFCRAIHLSNNAIQGKKVNGPRSGLLPDENMWTHEDFKNFLAGRGASDIWDGIVYPGMKQAINAALLCTQDIVECRKVGCQKKY